MGKSDPLVCAKCVMGFVVFSQKVGAVKHCPFCGTTEIAPFSVLETDERNRREVEEAAKKGFNEAFGIKS